MVCNVDQEAGHGGGEVFAADGARGFEIGGREGGDAGDATVEGGVEFDEAFGRSGAWRGFGVQGLKLGVSELLAFGVGQEAIEAAGDVAKMKGDGGVARYGEIDLSVGKASAPEVEIFA